MVKNIEARLKTIPEQPGVYQFLNKTGEVIYVGKAKNLKNRVSQYFKGQDEREQIPYLLKELDNFSYTVVGTELESLFLENTLIKKYLPKYNIQLRDDKNYAFITIDYSTQIPSIGYARKFDPINKKIKYFGPFSAAYKIRNTLNLVRRIFPFCSATQVSERPCFYYYIHRCPGVCVGKMSLEDYDKHLDKICHFLAGDTGAVVRELKKEMSGSVRTKKFETAARLRDQLKAVELLQERQNVILPKPVSWDIVSLYLEGNFSCINLFKIRDGKMLDKENFIYEIKIDEEEKESTVLQNFLEQYYLETSNLPREIYLQSPIDEFSALMELLKQRSSKKIKLAAAKRGKPINLVKLGKINAEQCLKNWQDAKAGYRDKISQGLETLKNVLRLEKIPERIECYDISNLQGSNAVGSMVVFKNGKPLKSDYRKFKIYSKSTPDDFAMMKEMLKRRLNRLEEVQKNLPFEHMAGGIPTPWPKPDLIVIDGGKGQLSAAMEILNAQPSTLSPIPLIGLAKRLEEIFVPGEPRPIVLANDDPALQLLQRLRDEAHRFGVTFHRSLRGKEAVKSALDDITGLGPKTKKLLKEKFGTVSQIKKSPLEELAKVVGQAMAERIKNSI